MGLSVINME